MPSSRTIMLAHTKSWMLAFAYVHTFTFFINESFSIFEDHSMEIKQKFHCEFLHFFNTSNNFNRHPVNGNLFSFSACLPFFVHTKVDFERSRLLTPLLLYFIFDFHWRDSESIKQGKKGLKVFFFQKCFQVLKDLSRQGVKSIHNFTLFYSPSA